MSVLFIFLSLLTFSIQGDGPGWITLCTKSSGSRKVNAGGCPRGVVMDSPQFVTAACVNGVWILSLGDCDLQPVVLVGKGSNDCFSLGIQVSKVTFLGKPGDAFAPMDYVGPSTFSVFWSLAVGQSSCDKNFTSPGHALVSINSENVVEVVQSNGDINCCSTPYDLAPSLDAIPPVRICVGQTLPGQFFRVQTTCTQTPPAKSPRPLTSLFLNYGDGIRIEQGKPSETFFRFHADAKSRRCANSPMTLETDCCRALDFEVNDLEMATTEQKRIDDQTRRVATKYLHWSLGKRKAPPLDHSEFVYVQLGRRIMGHVCPKEEFPDQLSLGMLQIFKLLIAETLQNSPLVKNFEQKRHDFIVEALKSCLKHAKMGKSLKINWGSSDEVCPVDVLSVSKGSKVYAVETNSNETLLYKVLDFPLEVIWKIMTFTHYFCAKEFRSHPVDHSALMVSFESFFNSELLKRWANPGRAFQILKLLFPTVDLLRVAATIDACVKFAQTTSDYKKWIERPVLTPLGPRPKNLLGRIWNNSAICLNSYWEANFNDDSICFPSFTNFYKQ